MVIPYAAGMNDVGGSVAGSLIGGIRAGTQYREMQDLAEYRRKSLELDRRRADREDSLALINGWTQVQNSPPSVQKQLVPQLVKGLQGLDPTVSDGLTKIIQANDEGSHRAIDAIKTILSDEGRKAEFEAVAPSLSLPQLLAYGEKVRADAAAAKQQQFQNTLELYKATPGDADPIVGDVFAGPNGEMLVRTKSGITKQLQAGGAAPVPYGGSASSTDSSSTGASGGGTSGGTGGGTGKGLTMPPKPLTDAQSKDVFFHDKMVAGDKALGDFLTANPNYLGSTQAQIDEMARTLGGGGGKYVGGGIGTAIGAAAGAILGKGKGAITGSTVGGGLGAAAGELGGKVAQQWLTSDEGKSYIASATPFVTAVLHKETGAAISAEEWTQAFQEYLPVPGDPKDVIQRKAENRATAIAAIEKGLPYPMQPKAQQEQQPGASGKRDPIRKMWE